ncbi:MAG: hypothetical protein WDN26_04780 [Chitinophagaceae bacterium]
MKLFILAAVSCFFLQPSMAQHCPFDGTYTVVIKAKDKNGNILPASSYKYFSLEELDTDSTDCVYSSGKVYSNFYNDVDFINTEVNQRMHHADYFARYIKQGQSDFTKENFCALLSNPEVECYVQKPGTSDYDYIKRHYIVVYKKDNTTFRFEVPDKSIHSVCINNKWSTIKPMMIQLPE